MKSTDYLFPRDLQVRGGQIKKILIIGSCLTEQYLDHFRRLYPEVVFDYMQFNNLLNLPEIGLEKLSEYQLQYIQVPLRTIVGDHIIRIFDFDKSADFGAIEPQAKSMLSAVLNAVMKYNKEHGLLTLVANFIVPQSNLAPSLSARGEGGDFGRLVRALNQFLDESIKPYKNAFVADVEGLANTFGKRFFLDDVASFYSHGATLCANVTETDNCPRWALPNSGRIEAIEDVNETYGLNTAEFSELIFRQMESIYRIANQIDAVKIVIFDLDNTLWRGQIAEHYEDGREWPESHFWPVGIWEAIQHLRRRGIVVSICSKNDEHIVKERWRRAVLPWLTYDDFLLPKINWLPKSANIKETLASLSLTAKSALFVDDNPLERAEVAENVPGIRVIGANPFLTRRILLWAAETQKSHLSAETVNRENSYKEIISREQEKSASSREDFLAGLDVRMRFKLVKSAQDDAFTRINELVNKTNQFNTTGIRWSQTDFSQFFDEGGVIYSFSVRDKFSDYGVVGAILLIGGVIRQFTMSCRVIGLDVEVAALRHVADDFFAMNAEFLVGAVVDTEFNTPSRDVYVKSGFSAVQLQGVYILKRQDVKMATPHIHIE